MPSFIFAIERRTFVPKTGIFEGPRDALRHACLEPRSRISQPDTSMELVYKILPALLWRDAEETGFFDGTEADLADGFIHFSTAEQIRETAEKYFAGQDGLLLVAADKSLLGEALRFEPSRGGTRFPHLYATLPLDAVVWVKPLRLLPDGRHDLAGLFG
jgi:uncharacterized protein (DUF952 family)